MQWQRVSEVGDGRRKESKLSRAERRDKDRVIKRKLFDAWLADGSPGRFTDYCRQERGEEPVAIEWAEEPEPAEPEPQLESGTEAFFRKGRVRKETKGTASHLDREHSRRDLH